MTEWSSIFHLSSYHFSPYAIPPLVVATLVFILGLIVIGLEKDSEFNRSFFYLSLCSAVWLYGDGLVFSSQNPETAFIWIKIAYSGFILVPIAIFHISIAFTRRYDREQKFVRAAYAIGLVFIFLSWTKMFFSGVQQFYWGYYPDAAAGWVHLFFLGFIAFFPLLGFINLVTYSASLKDHFEKKRTQFLILAFAFTAISNVDILANYGIEVYPFGYLAILGFVLCIMYSIIKYHTLHVEAYAIELKGKVEEKTNELKATQLKLLETGKISALASLSAGIMHQISQPITAIHGFARFMRKEMKETDTFYRPVCIIDEQSAYLKDMLEDLMELIRHREIKKENIDINHSLKRSVDLLTDELRIRRVDWEISLGDQLPMVYADAIHLQQIFMNIIVNAIQALGLLPKGAERRLRIKSQYFSPNNQVLVSFTDSGPGISPEVQSQLFEPFFSTKAKGAGIGLALCKDLIAEHGGEIEIKSSKEEGTVCTIRLPSVSLTKPNLQMQN